MTMLAPWTVFAVVACLLLGVWVSDRVHSRRHRRRLARLAAGHRWRFNATDRFALAGRIGPALPVPGAADVRVRDLMYRVDGDTHRYVFTALCTAGTITGPDRVQMVVSADETAGGLSGVRVAGDGSLLAQYAALIEGRGSPGPDVTASI